MNDNSARLLRLDLEGSRGPGASSLGAALGRMETGRGTPRFLGQVFDGGSMPQATDRVFLVHPVRLYGTEVEGAAAVLEIDAARAIPVVVLGGSAPRAGDLLTALAVGGRWVAQAGAAGGTLLCLPCAIPQRSLTLSWVNYMSGPGSTTLVFTPPGQWGSVCTNQLLFQLACASGRVLMNVTYFLSGGCPSGQRQTCSSASGGPFGLTLESYSCDPFMMRYKVENTGCPALWSNGYTSLTITE